MLAKKRIDTECQFDRLARTHPGTPGDRRMKLPAAGLDKDEVRRRLDEVHALDLEWRTGRTYAYVYDAGHEVEDIGREAFGRFLFQNAIDPTAFPSVRHLENDLVAILSEHLR